MYLQKNLNAICPNESQNVCKFIENDDEFLILKNEQDNGLIYTKNHKDEHQLICINYNKMEKVNKDFQIKSNMSLEFCEDGTLIRLYFWKYWRVATNNCHDAKKSFWLSNKSFDDLFWSLFNKNILNNLDKKNTYFF